jgi:hypothetical protein
MASLGQKFIADEMPKGAGYDPLPAGWYTATITKADLVETQSRTGKYIKVRYDIVGPSHAGRVVFGNLNMSNENPKAEEIGRQQIGEICRAIGIAVLSDTDQLVGGNLDIKLSIRAATEQYEAQNEVKGFRAVGGSSGASGGIPKAAASSSKAPAAAGGKAPPPWAKKS